MEQKEIEKGNEAISLFMGLGYKGNPDLHHKPFARHIITSAANLEYHSSWNWLMLVIDEIESDDRFGEPIVSITADGCTIFGQHEHPPYINKHGWGNKIESTFYAVVAFIKYHNSQPAKTNSDEKENH